MNLYKISQDVNNDYDTYDSAVVVAATEDDARQTHPGQVSGLWSKTEAWEDRSGVWCKTPEQVKVELIGTALDTLEAGTIIVASFNAG